MPKVFDNRCEQCGKFVSGQDPDAESVAYDFGDGGWHYTAICGRCVKSNKAATTTRGRAGLED